MARFQGAVRGFAYPPSSIARRSSSANWCAVHRWSIPASARRVPGPDAPVLDPEILLVPLSAFDRRGHRIGYGAGHYDRAIDLLKQKGMHPKLIGIAFDCQEVAHVPDEPHDVSLDAILTESGLRFFASWIG
jgi:5-formyltetrahydrofolate cyclo-ligase